MNKKDALASKLHTETWTKEIRTKTDGKARFRVDSSILDEHLGNMSEIHGNPKRSSDMFGFCYGLTSQWVECVGKYAFQFSSCDVMDAIVLCTIACIPRWIAGEEKTPLVLPFATGPCTWNWESWRRSSKRGGRTQNDSS